MADEVKQQEQSFWDGLDKLSHEGSTYSYIGKMQWRIGYKFFVTGVDNEETFFVITNPGDSGVVSKAMALAKAYAIKHGIPVDDKKLRPMWLFRLYKDNVKGAQAERAATWKGDRYWNTYLWTPAFQQKIGPSLKEHDVKAGVDFFGKIEMFDDPSGYTKKREMLQEDGTTRTVDQVNTFPYVVAVYATEAEAEKVASGDGSEPTPELPSGVTLPDGWTLTDFLSCLKDIKADARPAAAIAGDYGTTPAQILLIKKS